MDRTLRNRNARAFRGGANTKVQRVNDRTLDQMYIAFMNVYYLSNLWGLSTKRVKDVDEQLYPPEIVFAMKSSPYFRNWISDAACCNEGEEDVKTRSEVLGLIKDAHRISSLFRKRIPPNSMSSSMYKENAKGILHDSSSPRIKYGEPNLGVSDSRAVFIVERDLFYFYIFEEAGRFKVFGLGIGN
ncbi:MAG: hypothetical protein IPL32_06705 [Chloracidobacterium sp.]|nr:hypothetical protein [Chloracidobacterium sp.]